MPTPPSLPPKSAADPRIADVLAFWLGAEVPTDASALTRQSLWFTKSDAGDADIARRFGALVDEALAGRLDTWARGPWGSLALAIVLDQFTRNVHRGTPRSFAGDAQALALALQAIAEGHDRALPTVARTFLYLPLEHAEDPALQARSVQAFTELAAEATPHTQALLASALDYARQHQNVIARFGRFPHRNAILGRESTAEERAYLAQPGAGF
ncbi:hypothetical protein B2J86_09415 [Acidovorax sp. SRB_14]|uniref:DUF924 family protein n=1 Tax=Acidovorax sp. SRB_14 TaxID=1962699 RepID=UPI0015647860|nr:DUF924 family protein [Acidovorax sp. SRB_14]NMM81138.1 hypothetical protein [Acidovorax sp. SRB_14]